MKVNVDIQCALEEEQSGDIQRALADLHKLDVPWASEVVVRFVNDPLVVVGDCGEYVDGTATIVPQECADRGYSHPRWRVNRTVHGVTVHEVGHHIERELVSETDVALSDIKRVFEPDDTVSGYADENYRENFAECFRVYATVPWILHVMCPDRFEFLNQWVPTDQKQSPRANVDNYTGIIQYQIRTANTNKKLREWLSERGVEV